MMKTKLIPKHQNSSGPLILENDNTTITSVRPESIHAKNVNPKLWEEYLKSHSPHPFDFWLELKNRSEQQSRPHIVQGNPKGLSPEALKAESDENHAKYISEQNKKAEQQTAKVVMPMVGIPLLAASAYAAPVATALSIGGGFLGDAIGEELEDHHDFPKGTRTLTGLAGGLIGGSTPSIINKTKLVGHNITESVQNFVNSPKMQYVRYYVTGPIKYGFDAKLPTLYRRTPKLSNLRALSKEFIVTPPKNRFMFEDGTPSPVITNFTTDHPVISNNGGDWTGMTVHAFPGKILLGKNVISTRPQDTFTYGDIISVPKKQVKSIIIGDPNLPGKHGSRTVIIPEHKVTEYIRQNFRTPTLKDYEFMDYVFKPKYKSGVINNDINKSMLSLDKELDPVLGSIFTNGDVYLRTKPIFDTSKVLYDPAPTVDAEFRASKHIILRPTLGSKVNIK